MTVEQILRNEIQESKRHLTDRSMIPFTDGITRKGLN
jgi:hypothetical protein